MGAGSIAKQKDSKNRKADHVKGTSKSGVSKADSSQKPSKEKKKREAQENIRKATAVLDAFRIHIEEQKQKLAKVVKSYNDGEHPEHKEEYERLAKEVEESNAKLEAYEDDVKKLKKEEADGDTSGSVGLGPENYLGNPGHSATSDTPGDAPATSGDNLEAPTDDPLGTAGNVTAPGLTGPDIPIITTESGDVPMGENKDEDDPSSDSSSDSGDEEDDEEDKWSPSLSRKMAGLGKWDLRLEGTVKRWKQKKYVMADGPKNSTQYRLRKANDMGGFNDATAKNLMDNRYGEMKTDNKFTYGQEHAKSIQGVAWVVDENVMASFPKDFPKDVDLLKPKNLLPTIATTKTDGKIIRMKVVDCVVKIKWLILGVYVSSWESRQTVRRIWGLERGDKAIYEAAQHQEKLFEEWVKGKRPGRDQSATPFPGLTPTPERVTRGETPAPGERGTPAAEKKVQFQQSQEGSQTTKMSLKDWKEDYYEWNEIEDPNKMTEKQKKVMKAAWDDYNDKS